ncbi:MAG: hypothetical protein WAO02_14405 [Verrucomicrobiia bacterium]
MTGAVAAPAAPTAPDLTARIHFAGAGQVSADTNAVAFTNLWCSPDARALRNQTLNKLSHAPYAWFQTKLAPGVDDGANQLRPLLDDLLSAEWFLQVRDGTNGSPEYALAIHLDAGRAQLWQTNLAKVLEVWTGMAVEKSPNGWELKKHLPPNLIRFLRVGDWAVFGCGQDTLQLNDELARHVKTDKRPAPAERHAWLTADLNWPRLAHWLAWTNASDWPETQLQVSTRPGKLQLEGRLIFPQPPAWRLDPWRFPTNLIHQPIVSLIAVRGVRPWLAEQSPLAAFTDWLPNQCFAWALEGIPFQTFAAAPVANATNALRELHQTLFASLNTNLQSLDLGSFQLATNGAEIKWRGLPFVAPFLQAEREPSGEFLFGGFFPDSPASEPLPASLFAEVDRTNLAYYHWEVTAERLPQVLNLSQLALMFAGRQQLNTKSVAGKWLLHCAGTTPGNAVTEITRTGPKVLTFLRRAPDGLTAAELVALAQWLEMTNFPAGGFHLPPRVGN